MSFYINTTKYSIFICMVTVPPGNQEGVVRDCTAQFCECWRFKNPLDKLNFEVDITNLTVLFWENEFSFCLSSPVCVFVSFF